MKIRSLAPWFGAKRTLAPKICHQLGPHTQFFDLFCGSMAVLFAKDRCRQETVNDLHGDVINLARVCAHPELSVDFWARLSFTLFSEGLFRESIARLDKQTTILPYGDVDRAYWYFVQSWMGRNGVAGTQRSGSTGYTLAVRWCDSGGSSTVRWASAVASIPDWFKRLQNVVILNRDAFDMLPRIPDQEGVALYIDPPYMPETRTGYDATGERSRYEFDFAKPQDAQLLFAKERDKHEWLADELARFRRARVVVSYYDCDRVRGLYDGWTFLDCSRLKNLTNANGQERCQAPEVLILNGAAL